MITIRRFTGLDQQAVRDLISRIMHEEFQAEKNVYPTDDIEHIETAYGGIGEAFFVAVSGQNIVGTVAIKKEDGRVALLRRLFVASAYRNQKIGLKLLDRALQFCRQTGYEEIIFKTTSRMGDANRLCQKSGFLPRAKLQMGDISLLKLALPLRRESPLRAA